ncbi:phasin family protein [Pelagibius litoralis]|uniref:Phasin family protein n=1 Tax=Pelagibius litoralis TaxID=374515 RepID=A0A967F2E4_9PROT|nr:phasin family protein [Pelagibius litoralis]NIA71747.1 phasin family protein [Pelagibius litoralis]
MATARKQTTSSSNPSPSPAGESQAGVQTGIPGVSLPGAPSYEAVLGSNGENISAAMSASEAMFAGMAEVSQEVMTFAGERMRKNIETSEELIKSKDPEEIFEKQCTIARYAAEQYIEETSKLMTMMARITRDCWAPVEQRTKSALHDIGTNGNGAEKEKD